MLLAFQRQAEVQSGNHAHTITGMQLQFHLETNNTAAIVLILGKQSRNLSFQAFYSIAKICLQVNTRQAHQIPTVGIPNSLNVQTS